MSRHTAAPSAFSKRGRCQVACDAVQDTILDNPMAGIKDGDPQSGQNIACTERGMIMISDDMDDPAGSSKRISISKDDRTIALKVDRPRRAGSPTL